MKASRRKFDVVVVGGGIIGCSIAQHLLDEGASICLVDAGRNGTSNGSFGEISALSIRNREHFLLASAGMAEWRRWSRRIGTGPEWLGALGWEDDPRRAGDLDAALHEARERGYPVRALDERALAEALPQARFEGVLSAYLAPDDGQVDLERVLKACLTAITDQGGELLLRRRADLVVGADDVSIRVDGEVLRPTHMVLAAGTGTPLLAGKAGLELHMRSRPGLLLRLIGAELDLPGVVHLPGAGPERLAVRNDSSGGVLLEEIGSDGVDPSAEHAERLAHRARSHLPTLARAKVDRVGLQWRPCPTDGLPVIGAVPGAPNVHVAVCPKGATAAPAIGRLVARELASGEVSPILRPFSAARFDEQALQVSIDVESVFGHELGKVKRPDVP